MIQLGRFQRTDHGYAGAIRTLVLNADVRISAAARSHDKAPDHRVFVGDLECGAAWSVAEDRSGGLLNVKLDDPVLPEPIYARLIQTQDGALLLVWTRRAD